MWGIRNFFLFYELCSVFLGFFLSLFWTGQEMTVRRKHRAGLKLGLVKRYCDEHGGGWV